MKKYIASFLMLLLTSCLVLSACGKKEETTKTEKEVVETTETTENESVEADSTEEATTAESKEGIYTAVITIKDHGSITVDMDSKEAPITVENFVNLAKDGFYDGLTFHRIINGFMMQGGDPLGNGTGGSDQQIQGEFLANGIKNKQSHVRGAISMARAQDMNSASSQFFIVHEDSTFLDGQYACFGYVTDGMDVVDEICENTPVVDSNGTVLAPDQPIIESIVIQEN